MNPGHSQDQFELQSESIDGQKAQSEQTPQDQASEDLMDVDIPELSATENTSLNETNETTPATATTASPDTTTIPTETSDSSILTTTSSDPSTSQHDLNALTQLSQQLTPAESQAFASAAAAALSNGSGFHLFPNFDSNALAASVLAAAAAAAAATTGQSNHNNNNESGVSADNNSHIASVNGSNENNHIFEQAAAAMAAQHQQNQAATNAATQQQQHNGLNQIPTDILKRELMNQKVRADNRERKKRWRQQNEERNKDNDLRCRVNKRAHKLFGKDDSLHKKKWIEEEFTKRQQKRKEKERRKGIVDDTLGGGNGAGTGGHHIGHDGNNMAVEMAALAQQLLPNQPVVDVSYLTELCNMLGIPAAARSLIGAAGGNIMGATAPTTASTTASTTATTSPAPSEVTTVKIEPILQPSHNDHNNNLQHGQTTAGEHAADELQGTTDSEDKDNKLHQFPLQLLELLQQLQHFQPQADPTAESSNNSEALTDFHLQQQNSGFNLNDDSIRPEDKLAALLTSTLQAAAAANQNSNSGNHNSSNGNGMKEDGQDQQNNDHDMTENNSNSSADSAGNNNNATTAAEFPMDAVLTLMQLNAGWRQ